MRHDRAEVIQVIRTELTHRGDGSEENPNRIIEQFWSLDGELLAENDPCVNPRPVKLFAYADGLVDPGDVSNTPADRLSRGLFRSTGLSEHEGDDHGQRGEVGE